MTTPRPPVLYRAARRRGFNLTRARQVVQSIAAIEAGMRTTTNSGQAARSTRP